MQKNINKKPPRKQKNTGKKQDLTWAEVKEKGAGYFRIKFLLFLYNIFGIIPLKLAIYPLVFIYFIFFGEQRRQSIQYLKTLNEYSIKKLKKPVFKKVTTFTSLKHFLSFAENLVDKIISWSGKAKIEQIRKITKKTDDEIVKNMVKNQGSIFIVSHLGNTEAMRALGNSYLEKTIKKQLNINVIIETGHNKIFEKILSEISPKFKAKIIPAKSVGADTIISLNEKITRGELVVIAGDRTPARNQNKIWHTDFLGKEAPFPIGPFLIANLIKAPVYYTFLTKSKMQKNCYDFYAFESKFKPMGAKTRKEKKLIIEKRINEYKKHLENMCLKYPLQWYNFYNFWN